MNTVDTFLEAMEQQASANMTPTKQSQKGVIVTFCDGSQETVHESVCPKCNFKTWTFSGLQHHCSNVCVKGIPKDPQQRAKIDKRVLREIEEDKTKYQHYCEECGDTFEYPRELKSHNVTAHKNIGVVKMSDGKEFMIDYLLCPSCYIDKPNFSALRSHCKMCTRVSKSTHPTMGIKLVRQGTPTPADHKFTPDAKLSPLAAKLAKRDSISSLQSTPSQKARSSELSRMFGSEESTRASLVKTDSVQSLFSQKGITSASKSLPVAISKSETPKTQQPVIQEKTASAGKLPVSVAKKTHPASASATPSASKTSTPTVVKPVAQKPTLPAAKVSELKPLTPKVSDSASKPATSKAPAPKPAEKAPDSSAQWPDENDDVRINKTGTKRILAEDSDDGATFSDVIYVQSDSDLDQPKKRKRLSNAAKDKTADYPWYCQLCLDMFEDKKAVRKHLQQYHRITNDESAVMEPLMARHVDSETFVDMDVDNLDKEPGETSKNALLFVDVMMGKSGKDAKKCVLCGVVPGSNLNKATWLQHYEEAHCTSIKIHLDGDELTLDSTECPLCGTFFDNFLGLRRHLADCAGERLKVKPETIHMDPASQTLYDQLHKELTEHGIARCVYCNTPFLRVITRQMVIQHWYQKHTKSATVVFPDGKEQTVVNEPQCPRCKQLFTDFLALKEHCAKNCAVTIQEEPKRSELPSDSEDEVLLQSPSKFMLTKTNTLHKLICPKCNQPFDNELQLNAHGCTETGIAHFSLDDDDDDKILGLSAPI